MKYDNITKTKEREEFTMKKRFLSVLLVSEMGVAALAGCGGGNTSADNGSTAADQMGAAVEDKTDAADTQKRILHLPMKNLLYTRTAEPKVVMHI